MDRYILLKGLGMTRSVDTDYLLSRVQHLVDAPTNELRNALKVIKNAKSIQVGSMFVPINDLNKGQLVREHLEHELNELDSQHSNGTELRR